MRLFKILILGFIISVLTSIPLHAQTQGIPTLKRACSYQAVYKIDAKNQRLNHTAFSYAAMKRCGGVKTTSLVRV